MRRRRSIGAGIWATVLGCAVACSSSSSTSVEPCGEGEVDGCTTEGCVGTKTCGTDGTFGPCVCSDAGSAGSGNRPDAGGGTGAADASTGGASGSAGAPVGGASGAGAAAGTSGAAGSAAAAGSSGASGAAGSAGASGTGGSAGSAGAAASAGTGGGAGSSGTGGGDAAAGAGGAAGTGGAAGGPADAGLDVTDTGPVLTPCTIDFDSSCNVGAPGVCDTMWLGGTGCSTGPAACRSSGALSFESSSQITITVNTEMRGVSVYFVHQGSGSSGTMTFRSSGGVVLGTPFTTNADCDSTSGVAQTQSFTEPVASVTISVTGTVWIDDFVLNP